MYNPRDIIELIADNVRKTRNPFGAPGFLINRWWRKVPLKRTGDAMLYTGLMYQALPYIEKTTRILEKYEDTAMAGYVSMGRYVPKFLNGLGFSVLTSRKDRAPCDAILADIVRILDRSGVDFYYNPKIDFYSGILLYDLGDIDGFIAHARFVAQRLRSNGVHRIITVDPHTTYALKVLYPKYAGQTFEVKTYFELVNFSGQNGGGRITLHDPCFYGRYLELSDIPPRVLGNLGYECVPVRNRGTFTHCCGGPAESISPKLSREVLDRRVQELRSTGAPIVSMCPICMGNLLKAGVDVRDLSSLIAEGIQ